MLEFVFIFQIEAPTPDLLPVQGLHQTLLLLRDVLESHDTTLVPVVDKKENFAKVLTVACSQGGGL